MKFGMFLVVCLVMILLWGSGYLMGTRNAKHITPLSKVPPGEDTHPEWRLGKATGAAQLGSGVPCAVYRNGPTDHLVRKQTIVFWCATP